LLVGAVAAALLSVVVGPIMFRLRGHYFAIGTLALAAILQLVLLDQRSVSGGSSGYYLDAGMGEIPTYLITLFATVLTVVVVYYVVESRLGLGMQAIHGDEEAASGLGVNPLLYKMYAFVISSFFAGLAGGLYAQYSLYVNPESTLSVTWTISTLVVVVLGGMGTFTGPILGAVLFLGLDNFLSAIVGELATSVEGVLIIAFMIFLPAGLYGVLSDRVLDRDRDPTNIGGERTTEEG
ncbi:branched-chain amino acid ABC transporter permease, partial [Halobium palmae]